MKPETQIYAPHNPSRLSCFALTFWTLPQCLYLPNIHFCEQFQKYKVFTSDIIKKKKIYIYIYIYTHTHTHTHKCTSMHTQLCMCTHPHDLCYMCCTCDLWILISHNFIKKRPSNTTLVLVVYCVWLVNQLHVLTVHVVIFRPHERLKHVANLPTNCNKELKPKLCQTAFLSIKLPQTQSDAEHKSHNLISVTKSSTI